MTDLSFEADTDDVKIMLDSFRLRMSAERIPAFLGNVVAPYLRQRVDERFSGEGDDVTGKWQQLRHTTAAIRSRQGFGAYTPINRRTGALLRYVKTFKVATWTLTMPGTSGGKILQSKLRLAQVGGWPTATGSKSSIGPSRPAPARPVIGLGERDSQAIVSQLQRWVMGGGVI